jgi:hypothetical protein
MGNLFQRTVLLFIIFEPFFRVKGRPQFLQDLKNYDLHKMLLCY